MTIITRKPAAWGALLLAVAVAGSAHAGGIDQSSLLVNVGYGGAGAPYSTANPIGQSFTAGLSGNLSDIVVYTNGSIQNNTGSILLRVHAGNGTGGTILGQASFSFSDITSQNPYKAALIFDTNNLNIALTAGQQYTFDLAVTSISGTGNWAERGYIGHGYNPYAGGRAFVDAAYGNQPYWDLAFATYVDQQGIPDVPSYTHDFSVPPGGTLPPDGVPPGGGVSPVPEPGNVAMMLAGLGLLGAISRRRAGKATQRRS